MAKIRETVVGSSLLQIIRASLNRIFTASPGDYLASCIDGMKIHVHGNAQDQLGQIIKDGKLVVHGDGGQTFMYGAKGGNVYIMGNATGRPNQASS